MSGVSIPVSTVARREDLPIQQDPRYLRLIKNYQCKL